MRSSVPFCGRLMATIGLATTVALVSLPATASPASATQPTQVSAAADVAQARLQATQQTQALMALQKQWLNAKGSEKSRALDMLVTKAQERRALLLDLAARDPATVLKVAIPDQQQLGMPAEVIALLEQKVELSGKSEVFYEDYEDGSHKLRRFLKTPFGERFELQIAEPVLELHYGDEVTVEGVLLAQADNDGDGSLVAAEEGIVTAQCCTAEGTSSAIPPAGAYTFGEQKTLVMLVNFEDKQEQPWTLDQVRDVIFGTVNDFYLENSGGRTWFNGDVKGWFTLPMSSTVCDYYGLDTLATEAASAAGIDTSAYQRIVYAFPKNACGWSGLGRVGGYNTRAWLNGYVTPYVAGHELGHNFGLGHSAGLECGSEIIEGAGSCYSNNYGNRLDIMGAPYTGHFNAFQKERLGWLDQGLITATGSGSYTLEPYSSATSTTRAIKVPQGTDGTSAYYIEFRQPLGFDSFITNSTSKNPIDASNVMNGVVINRGNSSDYNSSRLLDMTPGSSANIDYDFNDPALVVGQTFYDANSGIEITTNWVSGDQINVSITTASADCTPAAPALMLTPQTGDWVTAGTTVEYVVSVVNNDSQACAPAVYELSSTVPGGWDFSYTSPSVSLAPGESASSSLFVTSSATTADGFYDIPITLSGVTAQVSDHVTYVVDSPAVNNAPVAQNDNASTDHDKAVTIAVLSNDSDPDGDALSVTLVSNVNGSILMNADDTITFTPVKGFSGTATFDYSISDGHGGSASATVSVQVSAAPEIINNAPVARPDNAATDKRTPITIAVLTNDSDVDGDTLQLVSVTQGTLGDISINDDGTLTYFPAKNFRDGDSFTYTISDGALFASATVTISDSSSTTDATGGGGKGKGPNK
ncbi:peptidase M11 [Marinobacterium nitratireducens]|uniref:Peptidase M11 n=1 Tax=Marinobacterium nitratireducens TaxID=518897 RepID=A0A917ZC46_9GAMM|nr:cadherin-like domain-containing protein [Marinobacterium nitratireducens]GGO80116.1 peptidase M11 [Marinobacterium nitratireducens]